MTTNVLSTVVMMMSSYRAICTRIHRVYHFHYYQQINPHNPNVQYRFDHMDNEEHLENLIELEYSKSTKKKQSSNVFVFIFLPNIFQLVDKDFQMILSSHHLKIDKYVHAELLQ